MERTLRAAAAAGDIGTILKTLAQTSELTPRDYIMKSVGTLKFLYYDFVKFFHTRPYDLLDMIDGMLFMDARYYVEKVNYAHSKRS